MVALQASCKAIVYNGVPGNEDLGTNLQIIVYPVNGYSSDVERRRCGPILAHAHVEKRKIED